VALELSQQFAGIRQGMKVVDETGAVLGQVRDLSQRSVLIIEAGSTRVFWVDGGEIAAVEGQLVRLKRRLAGPPPATTQPRPA
jgi:RNase P/RNase MRP subunit p29